MSGRFYDPVLGRWTQPDTIVPDPGNPQSLNRYSYVGNNSLRYTDPTGHYTFEEDPSGKRTIVPPTYPVSPGPTTYTQHEQELVALTIQGECNSFASSDVRYQAYIATAWNIRNRVESSEYSSSYEGVVSETGQREDGTISYAYGGYRDAVVYGEENGFTASGDDGLAMKAAGKVMNGEVPDPTGGALFFVGTDAFSSRSSIDYWLTATDSRGRPIIKYSLEGKSDWRSRKEGLYFSDTYYQHWPGWGEY